MVKRYSHTAIILAGSEGSDVGGEWIPGTPTEFVVKGQYFPSNSGQQVKTNSNGKEFTIKGEFSTTRKKIDGATRIQINSIGLDEKIQSWEQFQTHSIIYI
jgi:hypothetical protein